MKKTNALRILDQQKIQYQTLEYSYNSENLDVAKIASDNGIPLETIYKTLVLTGDRTGTIIAVVAGDRQLSLKKTAQASENKKVELAALKDLQQLTGYMRGGCSPIGTKKSFPVYFDISARNLDKIYVNAGTRGLLFSCSPEDLLKACNAVWTDITE